MIKTADDIDAHIGSRVRLRRLTSGISQEQLGAALGVTFQQVQKYEKGTNRIGAGRLYRISRILGVPVSWFYEGLCQTNGASHVGVAADRNGAEITDFISTPEGYALNRAFSRIEHGATRRRLVDLVRTIAEADGR
ncbi:MAG TPA: helix-turn-helix transcriptional regulator [Thermohalobaculum sp.]|nr:helix-turn-helix transcriptional regulator [Thermohalobaculum sp.]